MKPSELLDHIIVHELLGVTGGAGGGFDTAGAGLTSSGTTLNVVAGDGSLTVAADSVVVNQGHSFQLTSLLTLTPDSNEPAMVVNAFGGATGALVNVADLWGASAQGYLRVVDAGSYGGDTPEDHYGHLTAVRPSATAEFAYVDDDGAVTQITRNGKLHFADTADYTPSNVSTARSFNANSTTLDEVADVLGTLITDLQTLGVLR